MGNVGKLFTILAIIMFITGCGSGGSSSNNTPTEFKPDVTPASRPEPVPIPKPDPTPPVPSIEGLIVDYGYGQGIGDSFGAAGIGDSLAAGYGITVENPNTRYGFKNVGFIVTFYNIEEELIATEEGNIAVIQPETTVGLGGYIYLYNADTLVHRMDVELGYDEIEEMGVLQDFSIEESPYFYNAGNQYVFASVTNVTNEDCNGFWINAVSYNEFNEINGGGYDYIDYLPAGHNIGTPILITSGKIPIYVSVYAMKDPTIVPEPPVFDPISEPDPMPSKEIYYSGGKTFTTNLIYTTAFHITGETIITITATHDAEAPFGGGNFIVHLWSQERGSEKLLVNVIGSISNYQTEEEVKLGNYFLEVMADGDWDITVEILNPNATPKPIRPVKRPYDCNAYIWDCPCADKMKWLYSHYGCPAENYELVTDSQGNHWWELTYHVYKNPPTPNEEIIRITWDSIDNANDEVPGEVCHVEGF